MIEKFKPVELPIIGSVLLVYSAVIFFQEEENLNFTSILGLTIFFLLHLGMYLMRETIFHNHTVLYFIVQGWLLISLAFVNRNNFQAAYLGLIPLIVAQCIHLLNNRRQILCMIFYYYSIFIGTSVFMIGWIDLTHSIALLLLISSAVVTYQIFYIRQIEENIEKQKLLIQLESAYDDLETMTKEKEREKLARDIHDTLSQGFAGMLLKLETLEVYLMQEDKKVCSEILENAIHEARTNHVESRQMIRDLRSFQDELFPLKEGVEKEIDFFLKHQDIKAEVHLTGSVDIERDIYRNIINIIKEIFQNISNHAKATFVFISVIMDNEKIDVYIEDNGIGFDKKKESQDERHYGIRGIYERVKILHGTIEIKSLRKEGTKVVFVIPFGGKDKRNV